VKPISEWKGGRGANWLLYLKKKICGHGNHWADFNHIDVEFNKISNSCVLLQFRSRKMPIFSSINLWTGEGDLSERKWRPKIGKERRCFSEKGGLKYFNSTMFLLVKDWQIYVLKLILRVFQL
jgi:hypothetical protein